MVTRHVSASLPSIRRRLVGQTPAFTRSYATRDLLDRSAKPTTAPPRINIYRDVWPPLLSCVGIALVAYYGLEMWRLNLDYKYRLQDMAIEVQALKTQVDTLRQENEEKNASLTTKMFGGRGSSKAEGRSKWFGLF